MRAFLQHHAALIQKILISLHMIYWMGKGMEAKLLPTFCLDLDYNVRFHTYIIIWILIIDVRCKHLAQNSQFTLNVARFREYFVHVIVLFRQPLGYIHDEKSLD